MLKGSSSFCVVPWLHQHVNEEGAFTVCCVAEGKDNFLDGPSGRNLHIQDHPDEQALGNHPRLKELRRKMLNGEWDPICAICQRSEQASGESLRTGRNRRFRHHAARLYEQTEADGTWPNPQPVHLDMRLGNYCNLSCRMCGPLASKLWLDTYNRVQPAAYRIGEGEIAKLRQLDWVKDPTIWTAFRECMEHLESLHFAGGEPMMIPEMTQALEMCVESGHASHIELSYNTNLTLLPPRIPELWKSFKSVSVWCSVDGYGPLNEYIRRPSRCQSALVFKDLLM